MVQFFVDAMLGNVAKKLRLLGYDSKYYSDIEDSELIKKAKNENRIIISKDSDLIKRSQKDNVLSIHVTTENEVEQFLKIIGDAGLPLDEITGDTARCTKCNSTTSRINKTEIGSKLPQRVLEFNDVFWKCDRCDQLYWEGTHIENLKDFVSKIKSKSQS